MIHDCLGFFEPTGKDFTLDVVPDRGCHFISGTIAAIAVDAGATAAAAGAIAAVAAPAITLAGVGALGAAVTGGDPGQGALYGAIGGGIGGALGAFGGATGAVGDTASGMGSGLAAVDPAVGTAATTGAGAALPGGLAAVDPTVGTAAAGNAIGTLGPLSANAAATSGATVAGTAGAAGATSGLGSIGKDLVGLAALSSLTGGGGSGQVALPGPGSTAATQGPYFNAPLQYQAQPTRNPINPYAGNPNAYYTAGQRPEQTYFGNNSLLNYYNPSVAPAQVTPPPTTLAYPTAAARGGQPQQGALTLMRGGDPSRFSTAHGQNLVRGGGDGTSDSVPAELSDGEYVLTAQDVARIGAGSNDAGAKQLDQFRAALARKAGQKQFVPAKVKGALSHLGKAA